MSETNEREGDADEATRPGEGEDELKAEEDSAKAMDADVPQTPLASGTESPRQS